MSLRVQAAFLVGLLVLAPAAAWSRTAITSCNQSLSKPGELYVVMADLQSVTTERDSFPVCLRVKADRITIDLNGHKLSGDGNGFGIGALDENNALTGFRQSILIRNGTIENFGYGIELALSSRVEVRNVKVLGNGGHGIFLGERATVRDCTSSGNGWTGIETGAFGFVQNNRLEDNFLYGILTGRSSLVRSNRILRLTNEGAGTGIEVGEASQVLDNTLDFAGNIGIFAPWERTTIMRNTVSNSDLIGIYVGLCPSVVIQNLSFSNPENYSIAEGRCQVLRNR